MINFKVKLRDRNQLVQLSADPSTNIETVIRIVEQQLGLKPFSITYKNRELKNSETLLSLGIKESDILIANISQSDNDLETKKLLNQISYDILSNPKRLIQFVKFNDSYMLKLLEVNQTLAQAILDENELLVSDIIKNYNFDNELQLNKRKIETELLNKDPLNLETQKRIEETIKLKNVQENMNNAIEHMPEAFGHVIMLYIPCKINNIKVNAFVDSGAQTTIMSKPCAERLNLMRLVDQRWKGLAKGVGTASILGKVHLAQIKIGSTNCNISLTVIDQNEDQFIFGLDMLKRHQMIIDLKENVLRINNDKIPFLAEKDLKSNQENVVEMDEEKIKLLTNLGFKREESINALNLFDWNSEMAASHLFKHICCK